MVDPLEGSVGSNFCFTAGMSYYRDRGHGDERGFYRERPTRRVSIMVRNLPKSITSDDLKYYAEKYGPVKDVYLPRDYYTQEARGLGFLEFVDERDAADAVRGLDRMVLGGREIQCNYAMQGRKRPEDYRRGGGGGYGRDRGGYGDRGYDRGGYGDRGYDRGRDRGYDRDRDRDRDYDRRDRSAERDRGRSRSRSATPDRSPARSPAKGRSRSPARSPAGDRSRSRSEERGRGRSRSRSASPKRDRSPTPGAADSPRSGDY